MNQPQLKELLVNVDGIMREVMVLGTKLSMVRSTVARQIKDVEFVHDVEEGEVDDSSDS